MLPLTLMTRKGAAVPAQGDGARFGPFIFERTKKGFRFRFSFSVGKKK